MCQPQLRATTTTALHTSLGQGVVSRDGSNSSQTRTWSHALVSCGRKYLNISCTASTVALNSPKFECFRQSSLPYEARRIPTSEGIDGRKVTSTCRCSWSQRSNFAEAFLRFSVSIHDMGFLEGNSSDRARSLDGRGPSPRSFAEDLLDRPVSLAGSGINFSLTPGKSFRSRSQGERPTSSERIATL